MRLALRDVPQTPRTGVDFHRTPGRDLPNVPSAVKGLFVRVVRVENGSVEFSDGTGSSAAFGILITTALILASHAPIVTYSPTHPAAL